MTNKNQKKHSINKNQKRGDAVDLRLFLHKRNEKRQNRNIIIRDNIVDCSESLKNTGLYAKIDKDENYGWIINRIKLFAGGASMEDQKLDDDYYGKSAYFAKSDKSFIHFFAASVFLSFIIFFFSFLQKSLELKDNLIGNSTMAYEQLKIAGDLASKYNFEDSINKFNSATVNFSKSKDIMEKFGLGAIGIISDIPIKNPFSTAKNIFLAGENISNIGKNMSYLLNKVVYFSGIGFSKDFVAEIDGNIKNTAFYLSETKTLLEKTDPKYVPKNFSGNIVRAKEQLPIIVENFENLSEDFAIMSKALGFSGPQKYLLIFENNSEMRATGGFIGSYGIIDIENGKVKNFFIDGIFNPDGQLKEKIIPPIPIQKISANWSMHDANWFPDFPTSAKKIALFYEKTGGATVDGVIAITQNVAEKFLDITGPIEMNEYNTVIDSKNFLSETQMQVEELYDKKKNNPKQFLSDLAPKLIDKTFDFENLDSYEKTKKYLDIANLILECLREKHIILYHRNPDIENMFILRGWGGQMMQSNGDYLSVVHSNINGYKTDAVIDEEIVHSSEILSDGSIIDTVKITKKHNGGNSKYEWYNRVNSDYMRVYVPLGSVLLEVSGHTREDYEPTVDYSKFEIDQDVAKIEKSMKIDFYSGTHIFEESGKTVFGNWVYTSPGEKSEVIYKYKLPFKVDFENFTKNAERYSVLIQKQLGSSGIKFSGTIKLPENWRIVWNSDNTAKNHNAINMKTLLNTDKIYGAVFTKD